MAEADGDQLVEKFYMPLYRFALSLSRKESDAGDLVQETYHAWVAKGHQLRDPTKVKTWLFTTLYRKFLSQRRHDERFVDSPEDCEFIEPPHLSSSIVNAIDAVTVQEALHRLDERYRVPVTLFYMQQHSYREIAEILSIPIGTVMSRISRGKADLRKALEDSAQREPGNVVPMDRGQTHG